MKQEAPHTQEGSIAAQLDTRSLMISDLLPLMLASDEITADETLEQVVFALAAWDGTMAADQPEPLIFFRLAG